MGGITSGDFDFDYWPRGRIKYNVEKDEFQLMADRQIVNNKALLREVMHQFALPTSKVEVSIDALITARSAISSRPMSRTISDTSFSR